MKIAKKDIVIRSVRLDDYDRIVEIDAKVIGRRRLVYYRRKMKMAFDIEQKLVTSLVAEVGGNVVGFIMGAVYIGEFGVFETTATIETIGVDPDYQSHGIARTMMEEYITLVKKAGAERIVTQVQWNDVDLLRFFDKLGFTPEKSLNLEMDIVESEKDS